MKHKRSAGILLPISSLPSAYGIGTLGKSAYEFVDFLKKAGQFWWQILPAGPTGYGDSPYQSFSTFAGNPYFIDLEILIKEGLITGKDCKKYLGDKNDPYVNYALQYYNRYPLLKVAYSAFVKKGLDKEKAYKDFIKSNGKWLPDYALFMALKDKNDGIAFTKWDKDLRLRKKSVISEQKKRLAEDIGFYEFLQYKFDIQWTALKTYANENGIKIIGDIPIYVSPDSADVWADPDLFMLDKERIPTKVAGVPPDYFSATGQLWGNPLYDWKEHEKRGYEWWIRRMEHCFRLYDCVRIDHFRGFDEFWAVPYGHETAEFGEWMQGPGLKLFDAMKEKLTSDGYTLDVIAEDLGFMTKTVERMVRKSGFPNMKVLQFGFSADGNSGYLPHNYDRNCVVYTGTHDNDTSAGFYKSAGREEKAFARDYLFGAGVCKSATPKMICLAMIRAVMLSIADTAIVPMQDYLCLGSEARINMPSTLGGINWQWRLEKGILTDELAAVIRRQTFMGARCNN